MNAPVTSPILEIPERRLSRNAHRINPTAVPELRVEKFSNRI